MNEQQPKFHPWFHNFIIYLALWVLALFALILGIRHGWMALADGFGGIESLLQFVICALLVATGVVTIKLHFDLAAFRTIALKEMIIATVAGVAACLVSFLINYFVIGDNYMSQIPSAIFIAAWGLSVYRYYNARPYLFTA